jgi:hypothetical protein
MFRVRTVDDLRHVNADKIACLGLMPPDVASVNKMLNAIQVLS